MYGASYPNVLLRKNIDAAAKGQIGVEPEVILLGCIMLDPVTGKKTIVVQNVMKLAGIATVLILAFSVVYMSRKYKVDPMPGGRS
jgi:protein SCO1/2